MDDNITSNVLRFTGDTKVFRKVNNDGDKQHLQNYLDKLVKSSENMHMFFNFGDTVLSATVKEKDLWVTISIDMKVSELCGIAPSKVNKMLGSIRRNITYKEKS